MHPAESQPRPAKPQSSQSQFHLQWHQHQSTIVTVFESLWARQELVDVTLTAQGRSIEVHKIILCSCSQYFQELFAQRESKTPSVIFLKDVSFADLEALVQFMYKGDVHIEESQLGSFIETAKSLGICGITEAQKDTTSPQVRTAEKRRHSREDGGTLKKTNTKRNGIPTASPDDQPDGQHRAEGGLVKEETAAAVRGEDDDGVEAFWSDDPHADVVTFHDDPVNAESHNEMVNVPSYDHTGQDDVNQQSCDMGNESNQGLEEPYGIEDITSDGGGQFRCPRCGRGYMYKHTVRRHLRYECGVEPQFACHICDAKFHHNGVLIRHMKKHGTRRS